MGRDEPVPPGGRIDKTDWRPGDVVKQAELNWLAKMSGAGARFSVYLLPSGQCQETGRDQVHTQMGLYFRNLPGVLAPLHVLRYPSSRRRKAVLHESLRVDSIVPLPQPAGPSAVCTRGWQDTGRRRGVATEPEYGCRLYAPTSCCFNRIGSDLRNAVAASGIGLSGALWRS